MISIIYFQQKQKMSANKYSDNKPNYNPNEDVEDDDCDSDSNYNPNDDVEDDDVDVGSVVEEAIASLVEASDEPINESSAAPNLTSDVPDDLPSLGSRSDVPEDYAPILGGYAGPVPGYSPQQSHRELFNLKAFSLQRSLKLDRQPNRTSQNITPDNWNKMISVLENLGPRGESGDLLSLDFASDEERVKFQAFRKAHPIGYQWISKYKVEEYTEPSTSIQKKRLIRIGKKGAGRIAVPMHHVFDYIADSHMRKTGHAGRDNTYGILKEKCSNISQEQVQLFIKTCPACRRKNFQPKKLPGANKPILSWNFRDRFQVDLIDKRANPQRDIYGTLMKWINCCRDHYTGLTVVRAIPRKRPKYVAHVLEELWSIIGYPKIYHSDNGNEFTSKEIISLVKSLNPNILTVTGRPRRPSDQGAVERVNAVVERKIQALTDEMRYAGIKNPNWVTLLPKVRCVIILFI